MIFSPERTKEEEIVRQEGWTSAHSQVQVRTGAKRTA